MRDQTTLPLSPQAYMQQQVANQDDIPTLKAAHWRLSQPLQPAQPAQPAQPVGEYYADAVAPYEVGEIGSLAWPIAPAWPVEEHAAPLIQPCEWPARQQSIVESPVEPPAADQRDNPEDKAATSRTPATPGSGARSFGARAGRSASRIGAFSYRQMQPMRRRDWVNVAALVVVLIAMGAYMTFEKRSIASSSAATPKCRWHVVASGDTLASIARATGVSVGQIARANGIFDVNDPTVGLRLCLPTNIADVAEGALKVPLASQTNGPVIQGETAFVRFALPYARKAHDATGWPVSVILAQWGLEQGWQAPNFTGYNFGNCGGLIDEPFIPGTAAVGSPSSFAYADTPADGLRFYIHVAQLSYYEQVAPAAKQGGPEAAARALGASPWDAAHYTDHDDPGSSLIALMQQYNLTQFD